MISLCCCRMHSSEKFNTHSSHNSIGRGEKHFFVSDPTRDPIILKMIQKLFQGNVSGSFSGRTFSVLSSKDQMLPRGCGA